MNFNDKLQKLRKDKGLSQEALAELVKVSRQAVAKWELGGTYPDIDNLITLSEIFKVSIDKLLKPSDECSLNTDSTSELESSELLIKFLCKAKKATYAGKGPKSPSSRPNSHDLQYEEDNLLYIDTFLGGESFSGEEGLWVDLTPVWSMNYMGRVLSEEFSGSFLKEVLSLVPEDNPYRGPIVYENDDYKYHCIVNGSFEWFNGYEEIFYKDKKVFECMFHGGLIK
ncbi:MAG: DUF5680 domain-containing protein [Clostridium sp.]|nr:DUF5680 domain-containing protein [Clostridium sp.]